MRSRLVVALVALGVVTGADVAAAAVQAPTIATIQVQGNRLASDDEIVALAGIAVGQPFDDAQLADIEARLRATGRFDDVRVLKRFASIADPSQIALVIVIDDRPARVVPGRAGEPPRVIGRPGPDNLMVMPVLGAEDGYGVTYGARLAVIDIGGRDGRFEVPLTWGGDRRAGLTFGRSIPGGRLALEATLVRRHNPAYDRDDGRRRIGGRVERRAGPVVVAGRATWERVGFGPFHDDLASAGIDVSIDTRFDPAFPRNAVHLSAGWTGTRLASRSTSIGRADVDLQGYLGLVRQSVLVLRAERHGTASSSLPPYLQSLLGGWASLRGFRAGAFAGDAVTSGSLELRLPQSAVLSTVRTGFSLFVDVGAVQNHGDPFWRQRFRTGTGVGAWLVAPAFRFGVSVAHGRHAGTRVNFGGGFGF